MGKNSPKPKNPFSTPHTYVKISWNPSKLVALFCGFGDLGYILGILGYARIRGQSCRVWAFGFEHTPNPAYPQMHPSPKTLFSFFGLIGVLFGVGLGYFWRCFGTKTMGPYCHHYSLYIGQVVPAQNILWERSWISIFHEFRTQGVVVGESMYCSYSSSLLCHHHPPPPCCPAVVVVVWFRHPGREWRIIGNK